MSCTDLCQCKNLINLLTNDNWEYEEYAVEDEDYSNYEDDD